MIAKLYSYSKTVSALLEREFTVFKKDYSDNVIDIIIATSVQMIITIYILPYFGLSVDYGAFMLGGFVASSTFWQLYPFVAPLVADISGERTITYELMLPIPTWLVFFRMMLSFLIRITLVSIFVIPLGKLFLGDQFILSQISIVKTITLFLVGSLFVSAFGIFNVSVIYHMGQLSRAWSRFIFPLWMLGGFNFSWLSMNAMLPIFSYFALLNPMIYFHEGFRGALLGPQGFIPIWICVAMLVLFTFFFAYIGITRIKKRLDCM